jgi:hypothetical protein
LIDKTYLLAKRAEMVAKKVISMPAAFFVAENDVIIGNG